MSRKIWSHSSPSPVPTPPSTHTLTWMPRALDWLMCLLLSTEAIGWVVPPEYLSIVRLSNTRHHLCRWHEALRASIGNLCLSHNSICLDLPVTLQPMICDHQSYYVCNVRRYIAWWRRPFAGDGKIYPLYIALQICKQQKGAR